MTVQNCAIVVASGTDLNFEAIELNFQPIELNFEPSEPNFGLSYPKCADHRLNFQPMFSSAILRYTTPVSSKKELIGIGVSFEFAAQSRSLRRSCGFFHSGSHFYGGPDVGPQGRRLSLREFTGTPTRSGCRPDWRRGGSFTTELLELIMFHSSQHGVSAIVIPHPRALACKVQQPRSKGNYPQNVIFMHDARQKIAFLQVQHAKLQRCADLRTAVSCLEESTNRIRYELAVATQQLKGASNV